MVNLEQKTTVAKTAAGLSTLVWAASMVLVLGSLPWWVSLLIWVVGAVWAHFWISKGVIGGFDWGDYLRDSGIAIVVFLWPFVLGISFIPDAIEYRVAQRLGIRRTGDLTARGEPIYESIQ